MSGAETGHELVEAETYTLGCRGCRHPIAVAAAVRSFGCGSCGARSFVYRCERCGGTNVAGGAGRSAPVAWTCSWCLTQNMNQGLRRLRNKAEATAADAWAALDRHGLTRADPDARVLGGFTLVGGSGDIPPRDTMCSIAGLADGVLVVAEVGATGSTLLPYRDLLEIEVGGRGLLTTGTRMAGGGRGVAGAVTGIAVASMLNNATRKTVVDSFIRLATAQTEMVLTHWKYPPEAIRTMLSTIFVRRLAATRAASVQQPAPPPEPPPATPIDELERLTRLHAAGTLTENEFEAARAKQIRRLREPGGE